MKLSASSGLCAIRELRPVLSGHHPSHSGTSIPDRLLQSRGSVAGVGDVPAQDGSDAAWRLGVWSPEGSRYIACQDHRRKAQRNCWHFSSEPSSTKAAPNSGESGATLPPQLSTPC